MRIKKKTYTTHASTHTQTVCNFNIANVAALVFIWTCIYGFLRKDQYFQQSMVVYGGFSFFFSQLPESNVTELKQEQTCMFHFNIWCCVFNLFYNIEFFCFILFCLFKSDAKLRRNQDSNSSPTKLTEEPSTNSMFLECLYTVFESTNSMFIASVLIYFILCIVLFYPVCLDNCIL